MVSALPPADDLSAAATWPDGADIALCPSCLNETRFGAHFCHVCVTPLTFYAATGPLEAAWAYPIMLGKVLTTSRPTWLHLVVLYLEFGFRLLGPLFVMGYSISLSAPLFYWTDDLTLVVPAALIGLALVATHVWIAWTYLARGTLNFRRHHDDDPWSSDDPQPA